MLNNPVRYSDPSGHGIDSGIGDPGSKIDRSGDLKRWRKIVTSLNNQKRAVKETNRNIPVRTKPILTKTPQMTPVPPPPGTVVPPRPFFTEKEKAIIKRELQTVMGGFEYVKSSYSKLPNPEYNAFDAYPETAFSPMDKVPITIGPIIIPPFSIHAFTITPEIILSIIATGLDAGSLFTQYPAEISAPSSLGIRDLPINGPPPSGYFYPDYGLLCC